MTPRRISRFTYSSLFLFYLPPLVFLLHRKSFSTHRRLQQRLATGFQLLMQRPQAVLVCQTLMPVCQR